MSEPPAAELAAVLGQSAAAPVVTALGSPVPAATVGVWRVARAGGSAILKVVGRRADGSVRWPAAATVGDPFYWRRELLAYSSGLLAALPGPLRAPRCLGVFERPDGTAALWLEDVPRGPAAWSPERLGALARRLGELQGAAAPPLAAAPWLSRRWLRAYLGLRGPELAAGGTAALRLAPRPQEVLARVEAAPTAFSHLDLHPANVLGPGDDVLVDWAYCGLAALGEDAGNLVPDAIFDGHLEPGLGPAAAAAVWAGWTGGLAAAGWHGDLAAARYVFLAGTALKYAWLASRLEPALGEDVLAARRAGLELLAAWADEAHAAGG